MDETYQKLIEGIRSYLQEDERVKIKSEKRESKKRAFIKELVDFFNNEDVIKFLERSRTEISLFAHYRSSMSAVMCGSPPSYEIALSSEGLLVKNNGDVSKKYSFPAKFDEWYEAIPVYAVFHDSSSGDYTLIPGDLKENLETQLMQSLNK